MFEMTAEVVAILCVTFMALCTVFVAVYVRRSP